MSKEYTGEERRSIERDGTNFTEDQMKGAGKRTIEGGKTIDETGFTEGKLMRDAINKRLGVVSLPRQSAAVGSAPEPQPPKAAEPATPEFAESRETPEFSLEQFVKTAYPKARAGLLDGEKLCTPEQIPPEEEVLAKLKTLSKGKLEVAGEMKARMLVLEPKGLSHKKFMKNLDTGRRTINDTVITDSRKKQFGLQDKALGIKGDGEVMGWTMGIAEGAEELDGKTGILENLTAEWKNGEQAKKGATLVDHTKFALMQKQAIMSGERLDRINWSVLSRRDNNNETVCEDNLVSGGYYGDYLDRVHFGERNPSARYYNARFRVAVTA